MSTAPLILLAAGGTGGHLFPAEALGVALMKRGLRVRLVTDARALKFSGLFSRFAASGLAILFGVQAAINMSVNLQLIPAKGMTLPFISYGGSPIVSLAYGVGMMLALTRLRPRTEVEASGHAEAMRSYA